MVMPTPVIGVTQIKIQKSRSVFKGNSNISRFKEEDNRELKLKMGSVAGSSQTSQVSKVHNSADEIEKQGQLFANKKSKQERSHDYREFPRFQEAELNKSQHPNVLSSKEGINQDTLIMIDKANEAARNQSNLMTSTAQITNSVGMNLAPSLDSPGYYGEGQIGSPIFKLNSVANSNQVTLMEK